MGVGGYFSALHDAWTAGGERPLLNPWDFKAFADAYHTPPAPPWRSQAQRAGPWAAGARR
jgi:hypothetical protein